MKVERRKLTACEWATITSSRPVVCKVLDRGKAWPPESSDSPGRIGPGQPSPSLPLQPNKCTMMGAK